MIRVPLQIRLKSAHFPLASRSTSALSLESFDTNVSGLSEIERQIARLSCPRRFNLVASLAPQYRFAMAYDAVRLQNEYRAKNQSEREAAGENALMQPEYVRREQAIIELNLIIEKYNSILPPKFNDSERAA